MRGLLALLFVAAAPLRRVDLAEALHCSPARLERACEFLRSAPPYGLVLAEHADQLRLATVPAVGRLNVVERYELEPSSRGASRL
jgi:hypothetical protein